LGQSDIAAAAPASAAMAVGQDRPWKPGLLLVLILAVFYGALQNGQWVPISDADLYVAVARSIAHGQGFVFNGLPVQAMPPGWPAFLAAAMRVSGSFWFLGIIQAALMLGAMLLFYRIVLRLAAPRWAFAACLIAGMLSPAYHRTFMLYTEPLFCLLMAGALLLALQVNEGRPGAWRIPALLALAVAATTVRTAAVLMVPVLVGALVTGRHRPRWDRLWITSFLVAALLAATFLTLRYMPRPVPSQTLQEVGSLDEVATHVAQRHRIALRLAGFAARLPLAGLWFTELLAEPAHVERTFPLLRWGVDLGGLVLLAFIVAGMAPFVRQQRWLMPAALLYSLTLAGLWSQPVARYLVPVAPLLMLGLLKGVAGLAREGASPRWRTAGRAAMAVLLAGIALVNLSLYAVDVWKLHSRDFYGSYYAGQAAPLVAIGDYLRERHVSDCEVATGSLPIEWQDVSPSMGFFLEIRGLYLLIDRTILMAPPELSTIEPGPQLALWMQKNRAKYFVYRPPVNPWRVWHFRIPRIQGMVTGRPVGRPNPYFVLYELKDGWLQGVPVPAWQGCITRVPGL
jgi:hypothetical protein